MSGPKVVPMTLNRHFVLRSTMGHSVEFHKDKSTNVPHVLYADAIAIGAVRSDGADANVIENENTKVPLTQDELDKLLREALVDVEEKASRDDFTAQGIPTVAAVNRVSGEKYDSKSIAEGWKAYQLSKNED